MFSVGDCRTATLPHVILQSEPVHLDAGENVRKLHCYPTKRFQGLRRQGFRASIRSLKCSSATSLPSEEFAGASSSLFYLSAVFGDSEARSFWNRESFRSGSNIGSSRSSAGVSGVPAAVALS